MAAYTFASVKRAGNNAGRPSGKKNFLILLRVEDLATFTRAPGTSKVTALSFKAGKGPVGIYATPTTQNVYHQLAGDADSRGFIHHADFEHPGDEEAFNDFVENNTNVGLIAIQVNADSTDAKVAGLPSNPLQLTQDNGQDNNSANKHALQFTQEFHGPVLGRILKSLIPATDDDEVNIALGLQMKGSDGGGI